MRAELHWRGQVGRIRREASPADSGAHFPCCILQRGVKIDRGEPGEIREEFFPRSSVPEQTQYVGNGSSRALDKWLARPDVGIDNLMLETAADTL